MRALSAVVALFAALAAPAAAELRVEILRPAGGMAVFGDVEVEVLVVADEPIAWLDVLVDGRQAARLTEPPWRATVDVGQDNVEHLVRVELRSVTGAIAHSSVTTPAIRVDDELDVSLQELYVTVSRGGRRVLDLEAGDFRIFDEGQAQQVVTFARGDVPLTAVLLVDASESMRGERLGAALQGVTAFTTGMRDLDEAMVMLFSDRLLGVTPFTDSPTRIASALEGVLPAGGTALNDHLWLAMKKLDARPGRRVVVVLSDGADVLSGLSMQEVLWKARSTPALIYWIRLDEGGDSRTSFSSAWRNYDANRLELELLEQAVAESGGRIVPIERVGEIEHAFQTVLAELRDQYVLGYYPSGRRGDGRWRPIRVEARGMGQEVRARGGYYDH